MAPAPVGEHELADGTVIVVGEGGVISEINFVASAKTGDIIEIGCELVHFGTTSVTISWTKQVLLNKF